MKIANIVLSTGTLVAVMAVGGCAKQSDLDALRAEVQALRAEYVATHNALVGLGEWAVRTGPAVCNLEKHTNPPNPSNPVAGNPAYPSVPAGTTIRVCPSGGGDQSVPPPPPPRK